MLRKNRIAGAAMLAVVALSSTPTVGSVSKTIYLRAHVPVYCNVELLPMLGGPSNDGVVSLGMSQELCNSPRGYRVILQHPVNMPEAAVISDSDRIPLSATGETVLSDSDHAGFHFRQLALDLGDDPATINRLGLRMEVKY